MSKPSSSKKPKSAPSGVERRKAPRRPVVETFSLFAVIPKKGPYRLPVNDVSELGLGFDFDIDGESAETFPTAIGERFEVDLYLNQSLYLPLEVEIMRIETRKGGARRVGTEIANRKTPAYRGFAAFLKMLDAVSEVASVAS
jgi:hypothetical protein